MDSIERKKTKPYNINEKEILDIVAAKGSYLSSISENLEEVPPHKESSSRAESKKTITDEEVKKYIEALLNNFSSNRRKPLHIDAQVYECPFIFLHWFSFVSYTLCGLSLLWILLFPVL